MRVDLHCHSSASERAGLGVQRALALPECATPPQEVYDLAKRRGMDFVTITDHDTIAGVQEIAHDPAVFISEELTAWCEGEPQAVHVLCLVSAEAEPFATAMGGIARRDALLRRLAAGGLLAVAERTWERSLVELQAGYTHALSESSVTHSNESRNRQSRAVRATPPQKVPTAA